MYGKDMETGGICYKSRNGYKTKSYHREGKPNLKIHFRKRINKKQNFICNFAFKVNIKLFFSKLQTK